MKTNPYADTPLEQQPRPDVAALLPKLEKKFPEGMAAVEQEVEVTVVTAVFNALKEGRKEQLLQCLDSVQMQTGVSIEHLIVDGASPDGTADFIRAYRNTRIPIRLLSEPDTGIYDAMNRGLFLARGKYVIFLNSDDYYSDAHGLAESVQRLKASGADFSYAPIRVLDEATDQPVEHLLNHPNVNIIFLEMPFSHQSIMLRREAMLEINGFDLRYSSGADYDSILRLIFTGHRGCYVPVCFVAFRLGGFSFVNVSKSQQEVGTIFSRLYKKYLNVELSPEEGTELYLTKQCPKELRKRQFPFAKSAFGSVIEAGGTQDEDMIPEELFILQYRLFTITNHPGFAVAVKILSNLLFSTPVLFGRFLLNYLRNLRKPGAKQAGKQAFHDLLVSEQQKRKRQMKAAPPPDNVPAKIQTLPRLSVTFRDFWCVTGVYAGEAWGAWTNRQFSVFFNLPEECIHQPLTAEILIGGYVFPESPERTVEIVVNGRKTGTLTIGNMLPGPYHFDIPAEVVNSANLDIDFIADRAFTPKSLGHSEDTRALGLTFRKLSVRKAGNGGGKNRSSAQRQEITVGFLNHFNKWWVGGITYFKNLFQAMATTDAPHLKPVIFPSPDELAQCLMPYVSVFPVPPAVFAGLDHLPVASDYQVDVLSHLNGNQAAEGCDGIAWIADFQHLHLPEMFDEKEIRFRNQSFRRLIEQNRIVCLSSYDAMEDFRQYAPESADKARCLHFVSIPESGIYEMSKAEADRIRRSRRLPARYFYVPNQFWKHKNHVIVLKAISILKKSGLPIHVVFSGNTLDARFPHYFEELEAFCRQEGITENVHFLGLIPLNEVYFLMRDCLAMINPSKFEGWSSSVEEAKSIGKTIFLSNLNVHYEQMPPRGIYFPTDDPEWLADLLKRAWSELTAGPDLEMEKQAREALPGRIKQFGKEFQRIVLDALEHQNSASAASAAEAAVTVVTVVRDLLQSGTKEQMVRNLESVAAQRDIAVEHLIVDCGSADGTLEFLKPYAEKFNCRIVSEAVHGIYGAMNLGTVHAKGKYVSFLNPGDHYADAEFLKKSVSALERGNADFSYTGTAAECFVKMPFHHPSMLFLRKALYGVAGYNDTLCCAGEYELLLRLILSGKRGVPVDLAEGIVCTDAALETEPMQRECGAVYARLYSRLGFPMTPETGIRLYQGKQLPEELKNILRLYCQKSFGAAANAKEIE